MSTKERIFHSLLFEMIALALLVPFGSLISGAGLGHLAWVAVTLSLMAMLWNYVYNLLFDRLFGTDRVNRNLLLRVAHGVVFELVLVVVTIPVIMWALELGFIAALLLDLGMITFFLLFAIAFNWSYDIIRHRLVSA